MSSYRSITAYAPRLEPQPAPGFQLADFVRVISARKRLILGIILLTVIAAALFAYSLPTIYSSSAVVLLDSRKNNVTDGSAVLSQLQADPATLQNQIQILNSRGLAQKVITDLKLYDDPEFNGALAPPGLIASLNPRNWNGRAPVDSEQAHDQIMDSFLQHVSAEANGLSTAVTIAVTSRDPAKAARIANALAHAYEDDQVARKHQAASETTAWLENRTNDLAAQLQAQNEAVERYKAQNGIAETGAAGSLADQQMQGINAQIIAARADLEQKQANQQRLDQMGGNYSDMSQALASPVVGALRAQQSDLARQEADLSSKYGPQHPKLLSVQAQRHEVEQRINQETTRIASAASNEVDIAKRNLASLQASLYRAEQQAVNQNMARSPLQALISNAASTRATYETFVQRLRAAQDQDASLTPESRVISDALVPAAPSSPKRKLIIGAALPLGAILGVLVALLLERFGHLLPVRVNGSRRASLMPPARRSPRWKRKIKPQPGWDGPPILGEIANTAQLRAADYVIDWPNSRFAHASAALVRQLESRSGEGAVVALTAAEPGDSKSVVAVSLARAAAAMGKKTVIIDCDPARRSTLAMHADASAGLYEVLTGMVTLNDALAKDPRGPAFLLELKQRPGQAASMFASPQMARLLEILRDACDFVVLDCGPALTGPDAALIARNADATLLVSRRDKLRGRSFSHAAHALQAAQAAPVGLVIAG